MFKSTKSIIDIAKKINNYNRLCLAQAASLQNMLEDEEKTFNQENGISFQDESLSPFEPKKPIADPAPSIGDNDYQSYLNEQEQQKKAGVITDDYVQRLNFFTLHQPAIRSALARVATGIHGTIQINAIINPNMSVDYMVKNFNGSGMTDAIKQKIISAMNEFSTSLMTALYQKMTKDNVKMNAGGVMVSFYNGSF